MTTLLVATRKVGATSYTFDWGEEIEAERRLLDSEATRENFDRVAKDYDVIIVLSHGRKDKVWSDVDGEALIDNHNIKQLSGKKLCIIACDAGKCLALKKGPSLVVAFDGPFVFMPPKETIFRKFVKELGNGFCHRAVGDIIWELMEGRMDPYVRRAMVHNISHLVVIKEGKLLTRFKPL